MLLLKAQTRESGKNIEQMRQEDYIPGVVYGPEVKQNKLIKVNLQEFEKVLEKVGFNQIFQLQVGEQEPVEVLVEDLQKDPVSGDIIHIDLLEIVRGRPVIVEVALKFTGTAKAVKDLGGTLVKNTEDIKIKCLPKDIIPEIEVSLDNLRSFEDSVYIKNLDLPEEIKILNPLDQLIVSVLPPRKEKEETKPEAKEGEEAQEGEESKEAGGDKEGGEAKEAGENKSEKKE